MVERFKCFYYEESKVTIDIESVSYSQDLLPNFVNMVMKHSWTEPITNSAQPV